MAVAMTVEAGRGKQPEGAGQGVPQTKQLEELFREAMRAWQASCEAQVRVRTTTGRTMRGKGGEVVPLPDLVVTEVTPGRGDPRYLVHARQALAAIRQLWGVEAAPKPRRGEVVAEAGGQEAERTGSEPQASLLWPPWAELARDLDAPGPRSAASGASAACAESIAVEDPPLNRAARRRKEREAGRRR